MFNTFSIHSNKLFIVKGFIFLETHWMHLKMVFNDQIELNELYNFDVHQIYIICWNHTEKYIWKYVRIHFQYILTLTSPSSSLFLNSCTFWDDIFNSTAILFSLMRPFIWYTYWGWPRKCLQLHSQQFRWRGYQNTDFGFGLRGSDYPRDDRERSTIWLWIIKPS